MSCPEAMTSVLFAAKNPEQAELVKLGYFVGFTADQAATLLVFPQHDRSPPDLCSRLAGTRHG